MTNYLTEKYESFFARKENDERQTQPLSGFLSAYFDKFKYIIREAYKQKMFRKNSAEGIKSIKTIAPKREFSTLDELRVLASTPFHYENLRPRLPPRLFDRSPVFGHRKSDLKRSAIFGQQQVFYQLLAKENKGK